MSRRESLSRIETQISRLQAKAEAIRQQQKPGMQQLKALASKYGLTLADCKVAIASRGRRGRHAGSALRGKKVDPKYRNPANKKETWAGRGLKPRWLSELLKQGRKLEEFAIK